MQDLSTQSFLDTSSKFIRRPRGQRSRLSRLTIPDVPVAIVVYVTLCMQMHLFKISIHTKADSFEQYLMVLAVTRKRCESSVHVLVRAPPAYIYLCTRYTNQHKLF